MGLKKFLMNLDEAGGRNSLNDIWRFPRTGMSEKHLPLHGIGGRKF